MSTCVKTDNRKSSSSNPMLSNQHTTQLCHSSENKAEDTVSICGGPPTPRDRWPPPPRSTPKRNENLHPHRNLNSSIHKQPRMEQLKCSTTSRGLNKNMVLIHPHKGMVFGNKRSEVQAHPTTWMNRENIVLSERSQTHTGTYGMIPCM